MIPVHEIVDNFESSNKEKFNENVDFLLTRFREIAKKNGDSDPSVSKDQLAAIFQAAASLTGGYQMEFATYLEYLALHKSFDS